MSAAEKRRISVIDQRTGTKTQVLVPANVPIRQLKKAIVKTLGLPVDGQGGGQQEYYLALGEGENEQLENDQTLEEAQVEDGAVLRIIPQFQGGIVGKLQRYFTLTLRRPHGGDTIFETDFLPTYFREPVQSLVSGMLQRRLLFEGEFFAVRIEPRTDRKQDHADVEIVDDDYYSWRGNKRDYITLYLPDGQSRIDSINYLRFYIHSYDKNRTFMFQWDFETALNSLFALITQVLMDERLIESDELFEANLSAVEGNNFRLNPALTRERMRSVDVPENEIEAEIAFLDGTKPLDRGPAPSVLVLQLDSSGMPEFAEWKPNDHRRPKSQKAVEIDEDEIEIEIESVEHLVKPTPKSLHEYKNIEMVGSIKPADLPIYFRRSALEMARQAAKVSHKTDAEVGGFLVGNAFRAADTDQLFVEIAEVVVADRAIGTSVSINFDYGAWQQVLERVNKDFPDKFPLGWYHTHLISQSKYASVNPELKQYRVSLETFFSGADRFVHRNFFPDPWHVALVIDLRRDADVFFVWRDGKIVQAGGFYIYGD